MVDAQQAGLGMWLAFGSNLQLQFKTELINLNPPVVGAGDLCLGCWVTITERRRPRAISLMRILGKSLAERRGQPCSETTS